MSSAILDPANESLASANKDWLLWQNVPQADVTYYQLTALGLHRDSTRNPTHILAQEMVHVPNMDDPRYKFRVARAGVFPLANMLRAYERLGGLPPGGGMKRLEEMLHESRPENPPMVYIPMITFSHTLDIYALHIGGLYEVGIAARLTVPV